MSGKGDGRRPTDQKAFEKNHDALDWNNDKEPAKPAPKMVCTFNHETHEWVWTEEVPDNG